MSERAVFGAVAAVGFVAVVVAVLVAIAQGDLVELGVILIGPLAFLACGSYIWRQQPGLRYSRLLVLTGAAVALTMALPGMVDTVAATTGPQPWMWLAVTTAQAALLLAVALGVQVLGLLPDGRPHDALERRATRGAWLLLAIPPLMLVSAPTVYLVPWEYTSLVIASPIYLPATAPLHTPAVLAYHFGVAVGLVGVVLLARRYHAAGGPVRRQLRWVVYGGIASLLAITGAIVLEPTGSQVVGVLWCLPLTCLALSIMLAVTRHRSGDVDRAVRRWLAIVLAAAGFVISVLLLEDSRIDDVASSPFDAALVLALVAVFWLLPLRQLIERAVEHVSRRTQGPALATEDMTGAQGAPWPGMAEQLASTLVTVPSVVWARVEVPGFATAMAGSDEAIAERWRLPIRAADPPLGSLICGTAAGRPLADQERATIVAIVTQAAMGLESARLATRVVHAEEAARRRIERDIHDGAQQSIVAHMTQLELSKPLARRGQLGESDIDELQRSALAILDELRDLARGIHPSLLSDMGLTDAIEERAARMPIPVRIGTPPRLQEARFPDEIESTAYFVVCEAFANILKHADATSVEVSIDSDVSFLEVSITDDGRGFEPEATPLSGLAGLVDRVAALGGRLLVSATPGMGTQVQASLPLELRV